MQGLFYLYFSIADKKHWGRKGSSSKLSLVAYIDSIEIRLKVLTFLATTTSQSLDGSGIVKLYNWWLYLIYISHDFIDCMMSARRPVYSYL